MVAWIIHRHVLKTTVDENCPFETIKLFKDVGAELNIDGHLSTPMDFSLWNENWSDKKFPMPILPSSEH